ncbi:ATP-binding protein [Lentzea kentuckyensis]|uniref:ATP-binding protein n=1 Tax=Lentzea kentuckyensis TaxID=360086 RepID=UPI000A3B63C7|nr:ATP-binding protein [Lentzea kentuckyensis]
MAVELLGRVAELALLERAMRALTDGEPSLIEIRGGCGTGRSALLSQAVELARDAGVAVLTVAGASPGYGEHLGIDDVTAQVVALRAGHPVPSGAGPVAAAGVVLELARTVPVLVAADDADRLDEPTRAWLARLAGRVAGRPVMIVAVACGAGRVLDDATVLTTSALPPDVVAELVSAERGEQAGDDVVATLSRCTGGVASVLRTVLDRLRVNPFPREEDIEELAADAFADLVARALAAMPAEVAGLLHAIAACGPRFGLGLTCVVADLRDVTADRALDLLAGAGLVTRDLPPALTAGLSPDLVLAGMAQEDRDELHVRAARAGHRAAVDEEELARVLEVVPPLGDPWVVPLLRTAARRAAERGESCVAARHLERALREPLDPATTSELSLELARLESARAPDAGARRLARMLLEPALPGCGEARLAAADQLVAHGDAALVRRTFGAVPSTGVEHHGLAAMYWIVDDAPLEVPELGLFEADPLPVAPEDPERAGTAAWLCVMRGGEPELARKLARTALAAPAAVLMPRVAACSALLLTDDLGEAVSGLDAVVAEARGRGLNGVVSQALVMRTIVMATAGRFAEAERDLAAARSAMPLWQWHPDARPLMILAEVHLSLDNGHTERAEESFASMPEHELGFGHTRTLMLFVRALLALKRGDASAALALAEECGRRSLARGAVNPGALRWQSVAAIAARACGDTHRAARLCDEEIAFARAWGVPGQLGRAYQSRAAVFGDPDDIREAVRLLRDTPWRSAYASVLLDLAEITDAPAAGPLVWEAAEIAVRGRLSGLLGRARRLGWVPGG